MGSLYYLQGGGHDSVQFNSFFLYATCSLLRHLTIEKNKQTNNKSGMAR